MFLDVGKINQLDIVTLMGEMETLIQFLITNNWYNLKQPKL